MRIPCACLLCCHVLLFVLQLYPSIDSTESKTAKQRSQKYSTIQEWLLSAEIDELNGIKDVTQLCMFYIDLQGEVQRLQVRPPGMI